YKLGCLTVNGNIEIRVAQAKKFNPSAVAIADEQAYKTFKKTTSFKGKIFGGKSGVIEAAAYEDNDIVISALVGFSGVMPTLAALKQGKVVALANKETLVSAGNIITKAAKDNNAKIITVDSEHSAILQSIVGESHDDIEKIILTASGGPFRTTPKEDFKHLTLAQALNHPNWSMGSKITIDSATMMNKGLEVIEAFWLFDMPANKIDVLIHPQSIVHSLVQFKDGSVKAQLGVPDMKLPIAYALSYPQRLNYDFPRLDLAETATLTFENPDLERFPCLLSAFEALKTGGTAPAILNAANETAVYSFLKDQISYTDICDLVNACLDKSEIIQNPSLEEIVHSDELARKITSELIASL
ncbi:MAG: 1-deoxy-D-xylulose-5-phosphate reductoisomerase, partial [Candidatus Kapabacteria bacterium]|nr:1-deoxy-D-xylulose-5-phosphate reductoisomerase [Candidatus Kapabacteria bacterium]